MTPFRPQIDSLHRSIESELTGRLLPFWRKYAYDDVQGRFRGGLATDLSEKPHARYSVVYVSRLLWSFSAAYMKFSHKADRELAEKAFHFLKDRFLDESYGGAYWLLDDDGGISDDRKKVYGQAFLIYGLVEYHEASGSEEALQLAIGLYRVIEVHFRDTEYDGYFELLSRDWSEAGDMRLSELDPNEKKSMNAHLHIMEAYTRLYSIWPDADLQRRLIALVNIHIDHILDSETGHFHLFFADDWAHTSCGVSLGHDIEGSWLLRRAGEILAEPELSQRIDRTAEMLVKSTLRKGLDPNGALWNGLECDGTPDKQRIWWVQAEAVIGFLYAWRIEEKAEYLKTAQSVWQYTSENIFDRINGEWHWAVDELENPILSYDKISEWKGPYHNVRACLESLELLTFVTQKEEIAHEASE